MDFLRARYHLPDDIGKLELPERRPMGFQAQEVPVDLRRQIFVQIHPQYGLDCVKPRLDNARRRQQFLARQFPYIVESQVVVPCNRFAKFLRLVKSR